MQYIQTNADLQAIADKLGGVALLAADTEAAGYHRYRDTVCLLQLSTRLDTYVVDTLAIRELSALKPVFAQDETEVVFHDADYDLRLLFRDFGFTVSGLFDTKIAAQFIGEQAFGLGSLAEKYLGITLEKKHQRADVEHQLECGIEFLFLGHRFLVMAGLVPAIHAFLRYSI